MRRAAAVAALAFLSALLAGAASALNAPVLTSVGQQNRHPFARWTLPEYVESRSVEVARQPDQRSEGGFVRAHVVLSEPVFPDDPKWSSPAQLRAGTYYVQVTAFDTACEHGAGECGPVYSNVVRLVIPPSQTMLWGRGIGPYRIGQRYRVWPGRIRTERFPKNGGPGCLLGPWDATRIDYYPGIRVSWINGYLFDVATTRRGDRTRAAFVIGESRLRDVRERYPSARVFRIVPRRNAYPPARLNLGYRTLGLTQRTGYESWTNLIYWFNRRGLLVALETNVGGC